MKTTFEVACVIENIQQEEDRYVIQLLTDDDREVELILVETEEDLEINSITSPSKLWHKEQVLLNLLAGILHSEQRHYWKQHLPAKTLLYNRKKLDMESLAARYQFIQSLPAIEAWLADLGTGSTSTKDTYRRSLRVFLTYCVANGASLQNFGIADIQAFFKQQAGKSEYYVEKLYFALWKYIQAQRPELEKFYKEMVTVPKTADLLEHAPKALEMVRVNDMIRKLEIPLYAAKGKNNTMRYFEALRNLTITHLLFDIGLRLSELANLDVTDIELGKTAKSSRIRIKGKRNKIRYTALGANSRKWLEEYLNEREVLLREKGVQLEAVFISNQLNRMATRSIYRIFEHFDTHPHAARHTLLTKLVRNGNDLVTVKEIAGHSNINTTTRYSKPTLDEIGDILNQ